MEKHTGLGNNVPGYGLSHSRTRRSDIPDFSEFLQLGTDSGSTEPHRNSRRGNYGNRNFENNDQRFSTEYYIGLSAVYIGLFLIIVLLVWG